MFNVRPPWLYVRPRQPEDSLPGFHVAREALQGVQSGISNFTLQPYVQHGPLSASPGFAGEIRPPDGSRSPFDFLTGQNTGPTSPNDEPPLPSLTSLLFRDWKNSSQRRVFYRISSPRPSLYRNFTSSLLPMIHQAFALVPPTLVRMARQMTLTTGSLTTIQT